MLLSVLFAFLATMAFGVLFNTPKKDLLPGGVAGALGWAVFIYMRDIWGYNSQVSNFAATVALALLCEVFARMLKEPVTLFSIPAIIPLVPGLPMYQGMKLLMMHAYNVGMDKLVQAALDAAFISLGILLVSSLARLFKNSQQKIKGLKVRV